MKYLKRLPLSLFLVLAGLGTILDFTNYPLAVWTVFTYALGITGILAGLLYFFEKEPES
ncbi:MAG: hypothetical protein AB1750_07595 [Chloroflexota bacterium]